MVLLGEGVPHNRSFSPSCLDVYVGSEVEVSTRTSKNGSPSRRTHKGCGVPYTGDGESGCYRGLPVGNHVYDSKVLLVD